MQNIHGPRPALCALLAMLLPAMPGSAVARGGTLGVTPTAWTSVGSAADRDGYFLLTPNQFNQAGAVWQRDQVDLTKGFDRTFVLSFGDDDMGADGIVFVLQQAGLDALGATGQGLGYEGISPSVGVELDTFQNAGEPVDDHIAVDENGSVAHGGVPAIALANLEDGGEHLLRVEWSPAAKELAVDLDGTRELVYTKDLVADIFGNDPLVYLGFTAATGGARNTQYVRMATPPAELAWSAPATGGLEPPTDLAGSIVGIGPATPAGRGARPASPGAVTAYNVYRSSAPNVAPSPDTLYATVASSELTIRAPLGSTGSYFVVTAVYAAGESAPSNEVALGQPGASLTKVKAKGAKIAAKGRGFTSAVRVFLDGIAFRTPAAVKMMRKQVVQKGPLDAGVDLVDYLVAGRTVTITFVNDDETSVSAVVTVP
jgi:lectin family protein